MSRIAIGKTAFALVIKSDGKVWGWGYNTYGQLGNNDTTLKKSPVSVMGNHTFCKIVAGTFHSISIDKYGKIWSWGYNTEGQLGINSTTNKSTPVSLYGSKTFCQIGAGVVFSLGLDKNGKVWGWGSNIYGQLGINSMTANVNTPVSLYGNKTFCKISAGDYTSFGIDKYGKYWSWGYNNYGTLGINITPIVFRTPTSIYGTKTFCNISAGYNHTIGIDKNGKVWAFGDDQYGQLGDNQQGGYTSKKTPVSIYGATKTFCQIGGIYNTSMIIDKNGKAWGWGYNQWGQLGQNASGGWILTPVSILGTAKTFCKIHINLSTLAIDKNGRLWSWGYNNTGQLGDNSQIDKSTPVSVKGAIKTFCEIAQGVAPAVYFSVAIDKTGNTWGWGDVTYIGVYRTNQSTPFAIVNNNKTFCQILLYGGAGTTTAVVDKNGRMWSWGANSSGQLGNNTTTSENTPISVLGATKTFCQIVGSNTMCALDKNGKVWVWGDSSFGKMGTNITSGNRSTPASIGGAAKTFCRVGSGANFLLSVDKNGLVWGWGLNTSGQLGTNSATNRSTPVSVGGATKTFCQIGVGTNHSTAIDKNGKAWGWGQNGQGQLGNNAVTATSTPVSILGAAKTFCTIVAGNSFTLGLDKNGRAWGWGVNTTGQLGLNSATSTRTPMSVLGNAKTFCKISIGAGHVVAIDKNGLAWGWGSNTSGQLGNNAATNKSTPVSVGGTLRTFCQIYGGNTHSVGLDNYGQYWAWGQQSAGELGIPLIVRTPIKINV